MSVIASSDCSSTIAPPEILSEGNGELERSTSGSCTKLKIPTHNNRARYSFSDNLTKGCNESCLCNIRGIDVNESALDIVK